ncbi:MAG: diphosphate--fructose-6-phosphate 1-phosphotransferase [Anaerolineae bacterium]|nr:diphosphate--fructose-6-phosphate 1-phosphotransferase [Anaerolineae bacterium]
MADILLVAQSGGPSPVINASLAGILLEAQQHGFRAVYGAVHGIEGILKEELLDIGGEREDTLEALSRTPAAALGSSRYKLAAGDLERMAAVLRAHDIGAFIYIGGNGSMLVCHRLAQLLPGLRVMGVPKTIDNDLPLTDHTPGYGSAARFMALAARDAGRDLESMATFDDVVILEALGRDAGWLAAAAALLKADEDEAPHLVYVPEIPFEEAQFLADVQRVHARLGRVFVVVGEGLRDAAGHFPGAGSAPVDALGRTMYSLSAGVAHHLVALVRDRLQLQARALRPGLIGRAFSACISEVDRREALLTGAAAVRHLLAGQSGQMVALERPAAVPYQSTTRLVALSEVAGPVKHLPRTFMNAAGTMVSPDFVAYALPLIGDLPPPLARLQRRPVPQRLSSA